jgi:hypothetical protein
MGDRNNGNHDVGLEFPAIPIDDPKAVINLKLAITNAGHDAAAVEAALTQSIDALGMAAGDALGLKDSNLIKAALGVVNAGLGELFANCDGAVAADDFTAQRSEFDRLIPAGGRTATHTKFYPGSDSSAGCGSNSQYYVTQTLIRTEPGDVDQPVPHKAFLILSRSSGLVLDVPGASRNAQTPIQQYPDNGGPNQHWQLIPVDSGFFKVRSLSSGLVLDVRGASHDDHAVIQQYTDNGGHNQHWQFIPVDAPPPDLPFPVLGGTRFFKIRSRSSGKVLDVPGRNADAHVQLQQYGDNGGNNQLWQLISVANV